MTTSWSALPVEHIDAPPRSARGLAVLVPCRNEAQSIGAVVRDFRAALPSSTIYVYDNGSTDATSAIATRAGAIVRREPRLGKGNVMRRMFADIDADLYVVVDGDGTYEAASVRRMVDLLMDEHLDMVVGARRPIDGAPDAFRRGHTVGNRLFTRTGRFLFGPGFTDLFSGFRVLSRRFVKSFPLTSSGFEIETEITVHAVELGAAHAEIETPYGCRSGASTSKLRTYRDGMRILGTALALFKDLRPLRFFGVLFALCTVTAVALGAPVVAEYARTGLVLRFPTAILAAALQTLGVIFLTAGIILESVSRARREARKLAYLAMPSPWR
ncbi:MAG: glycosyltransferase [Acidimicrobiales bacterium]